MREALDVYLHQQKLGIVTRSRTGFGRIVFTVDTRYLGEPDALTEGFALTPGVTIDSADATNFFGGYAPEGLHRTSLATKARIDEKDLFGFLKRYGLTMAGALSFYGADDTPNEPARYRDLSDGELVRKLEKAQRDHDLGNEPDSGRSMLPGFQPKLLIARIDGQWKQPLRGAHSTHILKPSPARRPATIYDEFYSHQLTRHMGLSTFPSELVSYAGKTFLSIERYDRLVHGDEVHPIHQEDAAQALRLDWIDSTAKFQNQERPNAANRPTAARIAEIFGSFGDGSDVALWLSFLIYSVLVGNHGAHAKNVSIIHDSDGPRIADLYDAVPILQINDAPSMVGSQKLNDKMSLAIGQQFDHHSITLDHFRHEAATWGALSENTVDDIIQATLTRFTLALDAVDEVPGASPKLRDRLGYNIDRIASENAIGKPKLPIKPWAPK